MTPVVMSPAWLVLVGLPVLLLGALLLRYGLWPKRKGDTPYCRKCGYNLTGRVSERCPECGTTLSDKTIVRGERRRRPILISLGAVVFLAWLTCTYWIGLRVDWQAYWPTSLLIRDVTSSGNAPTLPWAHRELSWRLRKGRLSESQTARLIEAALAEQAKEGLDLGRPRNMPLLDLLGDAYLGGRMSDQQTATFVSQLCSGQLQVRPTVIKGDNVPMRFVIQGILPLGWWLCKGACPMLVDGVRTDKVFRETAPSGMAVGGVDSFPCTQPGRHTVSLSVPVKCYAGKYGDFKGARLIYETNVSLQAGFEVLESEPADYIKLVRDEAMGEELRKAITPCNFRYSSIPGSAIPGTLHGEIRIGVLPVGVVFKVVGRVNGKEYPLCYFHKLKGDQYPNEWPFDTSVEDLRSPSIDMIVQTYSSLARHTVEMFEIWDGELVYKDVLVEDLRTGTDRQETATKPSRNRAELPSRR